DFDQIASPVSVAHFSLYKLSRILLKHLEKLGFHMVNSEKREYGSIGEREIFMGHECIAINGADHGVTVTASFLSKGKYATRDIQCHFLVGTDGTGRSVRKSLGISMRGEKDLQKLVSVHFLSQELGQYLINGRPGMLFFIFNKDAIGVLIAHDLKQGKFVLQVPFYPPQHKLEDFSSEMCKRLMFKLAGLELKDVNVMDIKPWVMHLEVAEKFLSCNNRIILAGDAAHRFSPAGGFHVYIRYRKGALVSEDDSVLNMHEAPTGRRRDYIPCSEPGSRLHHMNVKLLSIQSSKVWTLSTEHCLCRSQTLLDHGLVRSSLDTGGEAK
uniref:EMB2421 n=1 Tax=Solanum tuberosum TaxID=4113 RepID=M1BW46_SOLTU